MVLPDRSKLVITSNCTRYRLRPSEGQLSKLTIHKTYQGENWVNVYHLSLAYDSAQASAQAMGLVDFERNMSLTSVLFTHFTISDNIEDTDAYFSTPLNLLGQSPATADPAPLWATLRIDFSKLGGGRPGRKYYRGCLKENLVGPFGLLDPTFVSGVQTNAQTVMDANTAGGENFTYVNAAVYPYMQIRQLRRGSKKRTPHHRLSQCKRLPGDKATCLRTPEPNTTLLHATVPERYPVPGLRTAATYHIAIAHTKNGRSHLV